MPNNIHTENTFEEAIEASLLDHGGYVKGQSEDFDPNLGLFPSFITDFLRNSQPKEWEKISKTHKDNVETKVINRLVKELDHRGALDVIRNGFTDYGVKFKMAFFKPETSLNPSAKGMYAKNH